jgi:phage host-nuclease inhibitor protein Gam
MAKRVSKTVADVSQEQFQESMSVYALAAAQEKKMVAKMEAEIVKIRDKYSDDLTNYKETQQEQFELIQRYAEANKEALFTAKRSMEVTHGKIGFRLGTPKLCKLPKWTWDKVLAKTEELLPEYVRTKKELDKDAIIDNRADANLVPHLTTIGVYVDQEEKFFIELKNEDQE